MTHKHKFTKPKKEDDGMFVAECKCSLFIYEMTMEKLIATIDDYEKNPDKYAFGIPTEYKTLNWLTGNHAPIAHSHTFPAPNWDGSFFTTKCACGYKVTGDSSDDVLKLIFML